MSAADALPWLAAPLREALGARRDHHAWLIHGIPGVGQFELAMALAQAWLCEGPGAPGPRPCGVCASCRLASAHNHPDLLVLVPETLQAALGWHASGDEAGEAVDGARAARKPSKEIKVEAVRQALSFAQTTASRGRAKVVVIYPAERLNAVAANALLKTLEEPAGLARFVLATTAAGELLPTVRSRCQSLHLPPPATAEAAAWLTAQGVADAALALQATGGQPQEALAWAAEGWRAEAWRQLPAQVSRGEPGLLAGWPVPRAISVLQRLCLDASTAALGLGTRYFPVASLRDWAQASSPRLHAWSRALDAAARHADHPVNADLLVASLVAQGQRALTVRDKPPRQRGAASLDSIDG